MKEEQVIIGDKRVVGVIHGSDSDLPQMLEGLSYLKDKEKKGEVIILSVDCTSQHRHTLQVQSIVRLVKVGRIF